MRKFFYGSIIANAFDIVTQRTESFSNFKNDVNFDEKKFNVSSQDKANLVG